MRTSQFSTSAEDAASGAGAACDTAAGDVMTLEAASLILAAIGADPVIRDQLRRLVAARRDAGSEVTVDDVEAAVDRFSIFSRKRSRAVKRLRFTERNV